ncbi:putative ATP-dependent DNA helicase [Desulfosarcina variabilis str. Montpellier]|uniref:RNA-binding domain-containing protein n=1 Tax=Desulfosarcina variabilis TaxID=2300 RepID=UPI003AFAD2D2
MDIQNILQIGETETVEFKATFGKAVIVSLSAFANTAGGKVVVGVDDTGQPTGLQVGPESEQRYINEIKTATYPQIIPHVTAFELDGRAVLVFEINEYPVKPVSCKNRYYKRVKNSNHLLSLDEIVDLQQQSLNISYDAYPLNEPLESLDQSLMERFIETANTTGRVNLGDDLLTNLTKLKLIQNGKPTLAAMLLFGNHGYTLHLGRFKAADTIIDDLLIKAPLITALDEAMIFIKKHINLSYDFDGSLQRKERWQYPLEGLRELLLNAVVHRDYKNTSDIVIKIFDDRILFTSPGRIYGNLTIADLQRDDYVSSIRNKLLAEAFYLMGEIEKYGTGFIRIRQWLKEYPDVGYEISEMGDFFRIQVFQTTGSDLRNDLKNKPGDLKNDLINQLTLPDSQKRILLAVLENRFVTQQQLSEQIGITPKNIRNNMEKLRQRGLLERVGPLKGGHWKVLLPK